MNSIHLQTQIGNIQLPSCIYNASGARCSTGEELTALAQSEAGAVLSKSCTEAYREGNPSPRYYETDLGSINSMGLPNLGCAFYADYARTHAGLNAGKPYFVSVSGLSLEENIGIFKQLYPAEGIAAIELNLSCPNVPGKPQTGYDFEQVQRVLEAVLPLSRVPVGVKLPPYFDMVHFEQMSAILNRYPLAFVTCINSIGNGLVIDAVTETVVIKPKNGYGGLGGDYVKPTALANVHQFYRLLRKDIAIIGCGGVKTGLDVFEHILCGAAAVQIGTQLMREYTACFLRLALELKAVMAQKGYTTITDFKGKLNYIS
ncbi:MAG TPA: dihydroorotate oxidase [Chitinophagales bacterium]|nr:dihydroorotate oxidase [Chitinophagales bacterium]HRK25769.1 dihydroorotate oxidase [Chitinophagales bacterium]